MKYQAQIDDKLFDIDVNEDGKLTTDGHTVNAELLQVGPLGLYSLLIDNRSVELVVEETTTGYRVTLGSDTFDVQVADERQLRLAKGTQAPAAPGGELAIKAPIPGLVVRIQVHEGEEVQAGQSLIILEAMKMENELRAPRAGVISDIKVKAGENVEQNATLMVLQ